MRGILTGGRGFSRQRVLYLRRRLDERERLFSRGRCSQFSYGLTDSQTAISLPFSRFGDALLRVSGDILFRFDFVS